MRSVFTNDSRGSYKLRECPFCGHSRNLSIEDAGGIDRCVNGEPDGSIPTWHVYCGYCGATGPEVLLKRENAVSAWNRRDGERDE